MKRIFFSILVWLSIFDLKVMAQPHASDNVLNDAAGDTFEVELSKIDIPVFWFTMKNDKDPTYDLIFAPEGCMGASITNNEYVEGSLIISRLGESLYESGEYVKKESGVRLKVRGNTSANWEGHKVSKPGYKIKLSKKFNLLYNRDDVPASKDWVLIPAHNTDINTMAGFEVGRICGLGWQPEGCYVAVVLNGNFRGVYYLSEAVTGEKGRADVSSSGYIIEDDPYWWKPDEVYFKSSHLPYSMGWTFKEPDEDDFEENTLPNIEWCVAVLENAIYQGILDPALMEIKSFAAWVLAHDIMNTIDSAGSNIFLLKDSFDIFSPFSTTFRMGPLWDFDTSFLSTAETFSPVHSSDLYYFRQLFKIPEFRDIYIDLWKSLSDTFEKDLIGNLDILLAKNPGIDEARALEYRLTGRLYNDTQECMAELSGWLGKRLEVLEMLIDDMEGGAVTAVETIYPERVTEEDETVYTLGGLRSAKSVTRGICITPGGKRILSRTH